MRQTGISPALGDIAGTAGGDPVGDRLAGGLFEGLDHIEDGIALAGTQIDR